MKSAQQTLPPETLEKFAPSGILQERITDAFLALDADWHIVYVNDRAAQTFGRRREDLVGKHLWTEMPEGVGKAFYHAYHQALADQTPLQFEEYSTTRSRWFENHIYPSPYGLSIFFRDVTERRETQQRLEEREEQYRSLYEQSSDAVYTFDLEGCFVHANHACETVTGYTIEELLQTSLADLIVPEDRARIVALFEQVKEGKSGHEELTIRHKTGRRVELSITKVPIKVGNSVTGVFGIAKDISDRKQVEAALRASEANLRIIAETTPIAMTMTRWGDSALLYANRHFREMFALPLDADLSNLPSLSIYADPADREALQAALSKTGHLKDYEVHCQRKDGTPVWINGSFQRTVYNGEAAIYSAYSDITRRRQMEEALRGSETLFRTIAETSPVAMTITRWQDGAVLYVNQHVRNLFGVAPETDLTRHVAAEFYAHPSVREELMAVLSSENFVHNFETLFQKTDGTIFWGSGSYQRMDFYGQPALFAAFYDITESKRLLEQAQEEAERDPLTGLLNHRAFQRRFEEESRRALGEGSSLAVAILDLDNFKFFNDSYGHTIGDDVLRQVADALRAACRSRDTLARFGGDEFAMLLPEVGSDVTADEIAARLDSSLREVSYQPAGYGSAIPICLSAGVALFPADAPNRSAVMQLAAERLLHAKTGGLSGGEARQVRAAMQDVRGFPMLDALVNAVDNKDRYTRRHSEDVMVYSLLIAREMGLDAATFQTLQVAALLHDVGKIGVPDAILRKPSTLTPEEFAAIQQHPVMGAVIVGAVPGMEGTLDCIRSHHERWDGEGYPDKTRGEATPLPARLMSVADAYSAMTSDRPYRKGKTPAQAHAILEAGAGSQWDPACVAAFLKAQHGRR